MSFRRAFLVVVTGHALIGPLGAEAAAVGSVRARATTETATLFSDAVKQFKSGQFAKALEGFTHVTSLQDSPNVRLYIGYCYKELGQDRRAHQAFTVTIQQALQSGDVRYIAAREAAQYQLSLLELKLAKITISVVDLTTTCVVRLDGEVLEPSQVGSPLVIEPGRHRIEATTQDALPLVREVVIEKGTEKTFTLLFEKRPANRAASSGDTPVARDAGNRETHGFNWLNLGLVSGGVGLVGFGVFTVAGLQAKSSFDSLSRECILGCSDEAHQNEITSGQRKQTIANVGLAVGIVGTLTGITFTYLGLRQESSLTANIDVRSDATTLHCGGKF